MVLSILPLLTIGLLNGIIGSYVLQKNSKALPNRAFALFAFSVAAWTVSIALTHNLNAASTFLARTTFSSASLMVFALLVTFRTFPSEAALEWDWSLLLFGCGAAVLSTLSFTPLIVSSASLSSTGLNISYGTLHRIFGLYIYSCFGFSCLILLRKYRASTGLARLQFKYLLLGLLVPGLGVTFTNLLIPLVLGTSRLGQYGPYFALIFLGSTAHALIRYRLMDIRLVLQRSATFVLALLASVLVLVGALLLLLVLVPLEIQPHQILLALAGSVAIGTFFPFLQRLFGALLDRYVYRGATNFQRALRDTSRAVAAILDFDNLSRYTTFTTGQLVHSERAALYITDGASLRLCHEYTNLAASSTPSSPHVSTDSHLITFLETAREPIVAEEVPTRFPGDSGELLTAELARYHWALVLPIYSENHLQGFIAVGPKLSGDPFFENELEFLSILTNQVGVAVRNAQLYQQVVLVNEYVDNILSTMDSGVIAVGAAGDVSLFNPAAERLTGLQSASILNQPYTTLPPPLASPLRDTLDHESSRSQFETAINGPDGVSIPLVCSTATLRRRDGSTHGALIVFSDLSRLKDLEREKTRVERLASFGALASGVAHEIKNPLVAIRTFAELLPERFSETDFRDDFSKVVISEIDRIDDLVGRLRGLAVPSLQRAGAVDIREPIIETLALLRGKLEQTQTVVHRDLPDEAVFVAVDAAQLKQLFLNLLLNAIEAMGAGGELTIRICRGNTLNAASVVVEVQDNGPGIPDSIRSNIFDPFFTTKPRGSGLGLTICRGITDAHRGTIRVESASDRPGTTIVVEFPAATSTPELAQQSALNL